MTGAGIYCGGPLYQDASAIEDLKHSGFTTVVAWSVHVDGAGNLSINDDPLVTDGQYTGPAGWPEQLADLKRGGSVERLIFSVGAGGTSDFTNIDALIRRYGIGTDNPLNASLQVLKAAIPVIDAIDFDDEDLVEQDVIVAFGQMIVSLGWKVTFCPYFDAQLWASCLKELWAYEPGCVEAFNLQCYSGGAGNDPGEWARAIAAAMGSGFDAAGIVSPGLWCRNGDGCTDGDCPDRFTGRLRGWAGESAIASGWLWLYDDVRKCEGANSCSGGSMTTAAYAHAILDAFAGAAEATARS